MTLSFTDRRTTPHARIKQGLAWPVDPAQYPLSGPSAGPVYSPPAREPEDAPLWLWCVLMVCAAIAGVTLANVIVWLFT